MKVKDKKNILTCVSQAIFKCDDGLSAAAADEIDFGAIAERRRERLEEDVVEIVARDAVRLGLANAVETLTAEVVDVA